MKSFIAMLFLILLCWGLPARAQDEAGEETSSGAPQIQSFEMEADLWRALEEEAREQSSGDHARLRGPAEVVPTGWIDDYDYQSDLLKYLGTKAHAAAQAGRDAYVYVFADWLDSCKEFRRGSNREKYAELFSTHDIVMVEYGYFSRAFDTKIRNLPIFLKLHDNGSIGPESLRPVSRKVEHPAKEYYRLKSFFEPE